MEPKILDKKYHVNEKAGCLCRYIRSDTEYFRPHSHNYYEIFLIVKGKASHLINSNTDILRKGDLLFIRDFDLHDYSCIDGEYFEFINLSFTKETFDEMTSYLGSGFEKTRLLNTHMPPKVRLLENETEKLFYSLTDISTSENESIMRMRGRNVLINIFCKYFQDYSSDESLVPSWLEITYEKMKKPQNFTRGVNRMYEISNKSREHLSRCFKKYYKKTPTEFVNELKLNYCAGLLTNSNLSVTDIAFECGFENTSWFYTAFEKRFGLTPLQYRKEAVRHD